jgi:hypothetical protein
MIVFLGALVHAVNPYTGQQSRITMSWNITQEALPGGSPHSEAFRSVETLEAE